MWILDILILFFGVILGGAVGSFIGVVERRSARGESFVAAKKDRSDKKGGPSRSRCESCNAQLRWFELIPVVSFVLQRGRCRHCNVRLSNEYLLLELAGIGVVLCALLFSNTSSSLEMLSAAGLVQVCAWVVYGWVLLLLFVVDYKQQVLPDGITLPAIALAAPISFFVLGISFQSQLIGALLAGGFFTAQFLASQGRWIGGGDIRLGVLMGVMLGAKATVVALFFAYILGASIAVWLLVTRRAAKETKLAFGTFLTIATFAALFFGETIADWYLLALGL